MCRDLGTRSKYLYRFSPVRPNTQGISNQAAQHCAAGSVAQRGNAGGGTRCLGAHTYYRCVCQAPTMTSARSKVARAGERLWWKGSPCWSPIQTLAVQTTRNRESKSCTLAQQMAHFSPG